MAGETNTFGSKEAQIWGVVSITVISLLSLSGAAILPLLRGSSRSRWMQGFIALAVATLSSDAILHILPQVLGVHHDHGSHEEELEEQHGNFTGDHEHIHELHAEEGGIGEERMLLIKLSAVLLAVYVLYLVEFIAGCGLRRKARKVHDRSSSQETSSNHSHSGWADTEKPTSHIIDVKVETANKLENNPVVCLGLRSTAMVILFGDGIHNFIDGVAVGASFATSNRLGLTTSLAVACHELPHEIGDFAVLLESGLSVRRALILNFISALSAFGGLFVGLAAVNVDSAVDWLLALTAGMFLYVAWLDMLVHLKSESTSLSSSWYVTLTIQNVGFIAGFVLIFLIGWFEDDLLS